MAEPLFSVITANFNSGDKLAASAASVRQQGADAEHLVMDGGSTDGSLDLARRLAAETPAELRVVSEPDRGVYDAMNKGVRLTRGRYLYFLGAGDCLKPGALRAVAPLLPAHDLGLIYGDALHGSVVYDGLFDRQKLAHKNLCHQAAFYGRAVFELLGDYDLAYRSYADWEFNLRCFGDRRVRPQYVPVVVADFEPGGISGRGDAQFRRDRRRILLKNYGLLGCAGVAVADLRQRPMRLLRAVLGRGV